jgi:FeS assembly protein IscX
MTWEHINRIAQRLHVEHFGEDISKAQLSELHDMIIHLDDFEGDRERYSKKTLKEIQERWKEINEIDQ